VTYKLVDTLTGYQLEPGDVVSVNYDEEDHLVTIKSIEYLKEGYVISFLDEYEDELLTHYLSETDEIDLYLFDDE
jgi:hypothetical protein